MSAPQVQRAERDRVKPARVLRRSAIWVGKDRMTGKWLVRIGVSWVWNALEDDFASWENAIEYAQQIARLMALTAISNDVQIVHD